MKYWLVGVVAVVAVGCTDPEVRALTEEIEELHARTLEAAEAAVGYNDGYKGLLELRQQSIAARRAELEDGVSLHRARRLRYLAQDELVMAEGDLASAASADRLDDSLWKPAVRTW